MRKTGWFSFFVFCSVCCFAGAELHEFKLPDGRSIKAEIVDYNAKLGQVQLKREDGKLLPKVKPSIFVKEDQAYIRDWAKSAGFRSQSLFKITCQDDLVEKWKETEEANVTDQDGNVEKETVFETRFEKFVYNVALENKNGVPLEDIKFDYRIYYEQDSTGLKTVEGQLEIRRLSPKMKTILKTNPVLIYKKEFVGDFEPIGEDRPKKDEGHIVGIWLKVYAKGADGKMIVRDVYQPGSLAGKYKW